MDKANLYKQLCEVHTQRLLDQSTHFTPTLYKMRTYWLRRNGGEKKKRSAPHRPSSPFAEPAWPRSRPSRICKLTGHTTHESRRLFNLEILSRPHYQQQQQQHQHYHHHAACCCSVY
ncbi:hypothetical protein BS50DRAFT_567399 [Corynespora cassiicola Philippines]|uniref:Uncharacterized protein n=1 Tax=Corynespora cassiicola Philippines TaxID=1448308 RepID=A0A2T2PAB4_CORCC|nr:hypothetical protein BS50DRAFT_567399 [Corynespora cassiicola Philippines]